MSLNPPTATGVGFTVLLCLLLFSAATFAKPSFTVKPEPAWVSQIEINREAGSRDRPTTVLIYDREIRLSANSVERFYKRSERVNTNAGLERLSQLQFYFEPSYESLAIHFIRVIRGGQPRNALEPASIKIIAKEDDLDEQIYNGTLSAVTFLKDIRVGDIVEYAYTVSGANPVFGGRFAERFHLADDEPIQQLRVRMLAPAERTLNVQTQGTDLVAKQTAIGSDKEYLWERNELAAVDPEDSTPSWFDPVPLVSVSEFPDWSAVAQWAAPYYRTDQSLPPELKHKAEDWLKQLDTPEQRMIAALRFVQQEIRYLGIELGPYSHRPSPPSQTFSRRFGDCKDKSMLLASVLNFMGIDCALALVNTEALHTLDSYQPSPDAFDHVIVQAKIGSRTFWLDPTIESQRGNVDAYVDPFYERALVLRPEVKALETIPPPKLQTPTTEVKEVYSIDPVTGGASLRVTTTSRGIDADELRYRWSQRSVAETSKLYLNYYAENNPSIKADGPPEIDDNEQDNVITVKEKYLIDSFWQNDLHYFGGDLTYAELTKPTISQRAMPLALRHPVFITQTIQVESVTPDDLTPRSEVLTNDSFRFEYHYQPAAGSFRLSYSLQTLSDFVAPQKVSGYLAQADRIWNSTGVQLPRRSGGVITQRSNELSPGQALVVFLILAGVLITAGTVGYLKVRRDRPKPFIQTLGPGSTPETAIRCQDRNDLEKLASRFKCRCGTSNFDRGAFAHAPEENLFYDGERLATIKVKCNSCQHTSDLYFVQPPAPANT